jgi:hypothetical protein
VTEADQPPLYGLDRLPTASKGHHLADYVELLCLTNADVEFSAADLVDRMLEREDVGENALQDDDVPTPDENEGAREDRYRRLAHDTFSHIAYRSGTFGASYPFCVERTGVVRRERRITPRRKLYLFLLLASNLRYMTRPSRTVLEKEFERFATEGVRRLLPPTAQVHPFGTAVTAGRYRGTSWRRYRRLADDLHDLPRYTEEDFPPTSVGDMGLDTVAWLPIGDENPAVMTFFAQTTCTTEWEGKQAQSGARWQVYLPPVAPRGNFLFIPFCFRNPAGGWYDRLWVHGAVVLDRVRLVWLFRGVEGAIAHVPYGVVDGVLQQRDALV